MNLTDPLGLTGRKAAVTLMGTRAPVYEVEVEQPWHRNALYLLATGMTQKMVAEELGKSEGSISNLKRQPWFQEALTALIERQRSDGLVVKMKYNAIEAEAVLMEILHDPEASSAVRAGVAMNILDRYMGKPKQHIETTSVTRSADPVAEARELELENARLREQAESAPHN